MSSIRIVGSALQRAKIGPRLARQLPTHAYEMRLGPPRDSRDPRERAEMERERRERVGVTVMEQGFSLPQVSVGSLDKLLIPHDNLNFCQP